MSYTLLLCIMVVSRYNNNELFMDRTMPNLIVNISALLENVPIRVSPCKISALLLS